jgi:hypothetical protein
LIYVYAIVEGRPDLASGAAGLGGASLRALAQGEVAAVYSGDPPQGLEPTEDALWVHERVVEELMATRAVLPLRFGSTLAGEPELRDLLAARHDEFSAALASVRGRVELAVRASAPAAADGAEPAGGPAEDGRAYLAAKLERRRAAARMGDELHAQLAPRAAASTFTATAEPRPAFSGAYLVDRARMEEFRRGFEEVRAARPDLALACTGPWPPFSFTEPLEGS